MDIPKSYPKAELRTIAIAFLATFILLITQCQEAKAQVGSRPTVDTITRVAKEVRPMAGMYCSVERMQNSYDEYVFVGVNIDLLTVEQIRTCMRKLPKKFTHTEERSLGVMVEEVRNAEVSGLNCSYVKPVGRPPQFRVIMAVPKLLQQRQIDECFEHVRSAPNEASPVGRGTSMKDA